ARPRATSGARRSCDLVVADVDDLELFGAARGAQRDDVADRALQQGRRDRRDPRDASPRRIQLVDADDGDRATFAGLVEPGDRCAEVHALVRLAGVVDDHGAVETLRQEADAAVDLAELALAVDVVAVLGPVAVARRPGDHVDELRTVIAPELLQLLVQAL